MLKQSRKSARTGPIWAEASAFQMRTFMSSLPLNTYTPSPLKRTAKTLRVGALREPPNKD